ncbi:unnamed protein product [Amoebophrya sp. A120]|nr:unnamed protein product [Amoebophrya sp. A120]|eukprot:GSA120T00005393001.1
MGDWCLIESDPAVFTELVEKVGVKGVKFDEVFDIDLVPRESYGLIFLFKCKKATEKRQVVANPPPGLFFAKQVITNACATQAILSVLLNAPKIKELGTTLTDFKTFTAAFDPQMKGLAISNQDAVREVHNSFSRQSSFDFVHDEKDPKEDAFHFIGYVPYNGKVYELDGLQEGPIEIGPINDENWIETVKPEIRSRMEKYQSEGEGEIRFNLLSIVEDEAYEVEKEILKLRHQRQRANIKMVSFGEDIFLEDEVDDDDAPDGVMTFEELPDDVDELKKLATDATSSIKTLEESIADSTKRKEQYRKENSRRRHDYVPFILCALKHLARKGSLMNAFQNGKAEVEAQLAREKEQKEAAKNQAAAAA